MPPQRKAWLVMLAAYLAGIAVALNQFKVPPMMQVLIEQLKMDVTIGGWLMSSFAVAGVILGIPAVFVLRRLGAKGAGLLALGCTIIGSATGALANDPAMLLLGRTIEGIGLGLISVVAPAIISMWFPPHARGTPMGIWASWAPVGSFLMFNLAGPLHGAFGWRGIWWFGALLALIAFVLYALVVSAPKVAETERDLPHESSAQSRKVLLTPASWILALAFGTFTFTALAYSTWAPSYLGQAFGLDAQAASFNVSLVMLAVIPSTLIAGRILDRVKNRYLVLTAAMLVVGIFSIWSFRLGSADVIVPYMLALGFASGFVPTAVFTLAPETMPGPERASLALGIVSVGQNLGMFFGPPAVAAVIASGNWEAAVIPLVAAGFIGLVAAVWLHARRIRSRSAMSEAPQLP